MLRPYQQSAHDAAMDWLRKSVEPCLLEMATGAGKSHVIAALAESLHKISGGKHILCLAPSAELVDQNRQKYLATGAPASIFSASAGGRCLRHPVVFGTPQTVKNSLRRFGSKFCAVVVDECHGLTPTVRYIIDELRMINTNLRVIGTTATPYRLGDGYIYATEEDGRPVGEQATKDPYFVRKVYTVGAPDLIDQGFLSPPIIGAINADTYETLNMQPNSMGKFSKQDIDQAYHGHGRKTAAIIADVVAQARNRQGVMIFAATIQHANECMASLPPGLSALVTGGTSKPDRAKIIQRFKAREIKYLVNVAVLTTGFDAPHVDLIAILRKTESVGLLQQIVGRGLRIDDGKEDCLILDYAQNLEEHCPDGDIFSPKVRAKMKGGDAQPVKPKCPSCKTENEFSGRPNPDGYEIDSSGYFVDLDGFRVKTEHGDMPAHFGRRCQALHPAPGGKFIQCDYRWTTKECPHCMADNDIAARYCCECKGELVDPNDKLVAEFKALKRDPTRIQTDRVISWEKIPTVSKAGNNCLRVDYVTEYRRFSIWYMPEGGGMFSRIAWDQFCEATEFGFKMPETVTYKKNTKDGFYSIHKYGAPADEVPALVESVR
jgi:DNA repair protein RadD